MIDWGEHGVLPNRIWGFFDLRKLPNNNNIVYGGLSNIEPAVYAIVESATKERRRNNNVNNNATSELFTPYLLEVGGMRDGWVSSLKFYLADIQSFSEPVVVVPDVGGPTNRYLVLRNRSYWKEDFTAWLDKPLERFPNFEYGLLKVNTSAYLSTLALTFHVLLSRNPTLSTYCDTH
jgi:hypothetical protein